MDSIIGKLQMKTYTENRKSKRSEHKAPIILEYKDSGYFSYAQMINFSGFGMCFESDVAFNPGTNIKIKLNKPLYRAAPRTYNAMVRWCNELADDYDLANYSSGVQFI